MKIHKEKGKSKEISTFEQWKQEEKEEDKLRKYKQHCSYFKHKKCDGYKGFEGCKVCKSLKKQDYRNGLPFVNTVEYEDLINDTETTFLTFHKNCNLRFDEKRCRYKNVFNFCSFCSCSFSRER